MNHKWLSIKSSKDGKTATIDIDGIIGMDFWTGEGITRQNISAELKQIAAVKGDTIIVNINSYGGDINDGLSIHDALASNPAKKEVRINGMTASAATVIAMAGDVIKMSENALFLVHRCWNMVVGNANQLKAAMDAQVKIDNLMIDLYAKKTGRPSEEITAQLDVNDGNGEWLTAEEAKAKGYINEIFAPTAIAASADPAAMKKLGLPAIPKDKLKTTIQMKNEKPADKTNFRARFDKLVVAMAQAFGIQAEKKEYETADGKKINIEMAGEEPAVGDTVTDESGEPTPDATYEVTELGTIKTDADSKISEITPVTEEEAEEEEAPADDTAALAAISTELGCKPEEVLSKIKSLKAENAEFSANEAHYETQLKALGKQIKSNFKPNEGDARFSKTKTASTGVVAEGLEAFKNRRKKGNEPKK